MKKKKKKFSLHIGNFMLILPLLNYSKNLLYGYCFYLFVFFCIENKENDFTIETRGQLWATWKFCCL